MTNKVFISSLVLFIFCLLPFNKNYAKSSRRYAKKKAKPVVIDTTDYSKHVWGIDISHHQGDIKWDKLDKNDKPHFIFFKVTEGNSLTDRKYNEHIKSARKLNIHCGAYHFFGYQSSGKQQAQHFIRNAKLQKGDLHPVLDVEFTKSTRRAKINIAKEIKAFCVEIYKSYKVYPIIYCNEAYYNTYLKKSFNDYNLWVCNYQKKPKLNWVFWQHTDKAKVNGINGNVDKNRLNPNKKIDYYVLK